MKQGAGIVLIAAAVAALLLTGTASAEPNARRNIVVFAGNGNPQVVAAIHRLSCARVRRNGDRKFEATGRDGRWKLEITINNFTGFHPYDLEYGIKQANFKLDPPGGGGFYSNFFFPGDEPPPLSGNLLFPSGNTRLGISFPAAFSSSGDDNDAVALAGRTRCR